MIEYPEMMNSSKAPRKPCLAFKKYDGSNIRVKFTQKNGFCLFGSRHELLDETHPFLGEVVGVFNRDFKPILEPYFKREFPDAREAIVFGEFFGSQSFAGRHFPNDPKEFVMFDVLLGHKNRKFINPREFMKRFSTMVKIPEVVYEGNLNDQFILDVRDGKIVTGEGVVCKGVETSGAYRGSIWMCKIKTNAYLQKLRDTFREDWNKYWE